MEKTVKNKKNNSGNIIISIVAVIGFILCTLLLLYPVISEKWNGYRAKQLIDDYVEEVGSGDPEAYEEELNKARKYNEELYSKGKNIVTETVLVTDEYYESMLNVTKTGILCYIEIPKINLKEPVYHYSTDESLNKGIGHIHGSSLPVDGINTHAILTGHRGLPGQKLFTDLDRIEEGDQFYIHVLNHTYAYRVCDRKVVLPYEVDDLIIEDGRDIITLVTCEPYGVNTHRLLITGERVEFDETNVKGGLVTTEPHTNVVEPAVVIVIAFAAFIITFALILLIAKLLSKRKKAPAAVVSAPKQEKEQKVKAPLFAALRNRIAERKEASAYRKMQKTAMALPATAKRSPAREASYAEEKETKQLHGPLFYIMIGIAIGGAIVGAIIIVYKFIKRRNEKKTEK